MASQSLDRKALKHDAFRDWAWDWIGRLYKYRFWAIGAGVVVLLAAAGTGLFLYQSNVSHRQQAAAFYEAEKHFSTPDADKKARLAAARQAFQGFVKEHPDGRLTPFAHMYLAHIAWEEKDLDAAQFHFKQAQAHPQSPDSTRNLAAIGVARVHEMRGEFDAAEAIYRALPEETFGEVKALQLGRLALARGEPQKAKEQLEGLAKRFPPDRLSSWAGETLSALP